jgi:Trp operon repressor
MKFNFPPPQTPAERDCLVRRMERLREMRDEGEISRRQFKHEYGALATTLWGPDFFRKARALTRQGNQVSEGGDNGRT